MRVNVPFVVVLALFVFCADVGRGYGRDDDDDDRKDPCGMDKDEGSCHEHHKRFFFEKTSKCCKAFYHKGCRKNENNFANREECYKKCDKHERRETDEETNAHKFKVQMKNPFSFYKQHKAEYEKNFMEAVAEKLPVSTKEIKILAAVEGSTILTVEVQRSFKDQSFETLVKEIQAGRFTITVAGTSIASVPNQDPEPETYDGPAKRGKRCRKIAFIVGMVLLGIGAIVGLIILIKVIKKKKMRASPVETAKNAIQTVWKSDSPEFVTTEKKQPPPEYDPTMAAPYPSVAPAYEAQTPPAYESPAPPYSAQAPEDYYPTKNPDEIPA